MIKRRLQDHANGIEDQTTGISAVYVDRPSDCFTGIIFGLPVSIISWVGIFYLISATQKIIF